MANADRPIASESLRGEWTVNDALQYLTRVAGLHDQEAVHQLNELLRAGRVRPTCLHFVDGVLRGRGVPPPTFWYDHLCVNIDGGRGYVRALKALDPGQYEFWFSAQDASAIRERFPKIKDALATSVVSGPIDPSSWLSSAVGSLNARSPRLSITEAAKTIATQMDVAAKSQQVPRAWKWTYIKNLLLEHGYWPRKRPPKR
jgi:hypothetical protein